MNWEKYRDSDGNLDLRRVYRAKHNITSGLNTMGEQYIINLLEMQPIVSIQVAANIIATATYIDKL